MKTPNSNLDGRIRGRQIDIEFNDLPSNKPQEIKLHVATTQQKLHLWLFIVLLLGCLT